MFSKIKLLSLFAFLIQISDLAALNTWEIRLKMRERERAQAAKMKAQGRGRGSSTKSSKPSSANSGTAAGSTTTRGAVEQKKIMHTVVHSGGQNSHASQSNTAGLREGAKIASSDNHNADRSRNGPMHHSHEKAMQNHTHHQPSPANSGSNGGYPVNYFNLQNAQGNHSSQSPTSNEAAPVKPQNAPPAPSKNQPPATPAPSAPPTGAKPEPSKGPAAAPAKPTNNPSSQTAGKSNSSPTHLKIKSKLPDKTTEAIAGGIISGTLDILRTTDASALCGNIQLGQDSETNISTNGSIQFKQEKNDATTLGNNAIVSGQTLTTEIVSPTKPITFFDNLSKQFKPRASGNFTNWAFNTHFRPSTISELRGIPTRRTYISRPKPKLNTPKFNAKLTQAEYTQSSAAGSADIFMVDMDGQAIKLIGQKTRAQLSKAAQELLTDCHIPHQTFESLAHNELYTHLEQQAHGLMEDAGELFARYNNDPYITAYSQAIAHGSSAIFNCLRSGDAQQAKAISNIIAGLSQARKIAWGAAKGIGQGVATSVGDALKSIMCPPLALYDLADTVFQMGKLAYDYYDQNPETLKALAELKKQMRDLPLEGWVENATAFITKLFLTPKKIGAKLKDINKLAEKVTELLKQKAAQIKKLPRKAISNVKKDIIRKPTAFVEVVTPEGRVYRIGAPDNDAQLHQMSAHGPSGSKPKFGSAGSSGSNNSTLATPTQSHAIPDFIRDNQVPRDHQTILKSANFTKTKVPHVLGAQVYKKDGKYYHRDTLHKGKGAHLEVYNSRGQHIGEANPITGELIPNTADKTKKDLNL